MKASKRTRQIALAFIVLLVLISTVRVIRPGVSRAPDFSCSSASAKLVKIDIESGETGSEIGNSLEKAGVVKSSLAFFRAAVADPRSSRIAPGSHSIETHLCAREALAQLLDSKRISNLIAVTEGAWNSEIKVSLYKAGFTQSEVFAGFVNFKKPTGFVTLEGLLFPAQYSFDTSTSVNEVLSTMSQRGLVEMERAGLFSSSEKFTPAQLLTIASLVQAEGDEKDFTKISQVVRNRLTKGMPLQFDSTVHFIKGSRGSVFLSTQSTYLNSPYNTYRHYGLPPGPINNPGSKAMFAAANPQPGRWLFFITVSPGDTRFTASIDEFNGWKVLYKKNLKAGKFRSVK
jgi:UPF0755 protein